MQTEEDRRRQAPKTLVLLFSGTEAYNPEAYNFVAMLGFFREPIKIYFLIRNYW